MLCLAKYKKISIDDVSLKRTESVEWYISSEVRALPFGGHRGKFSGFDVVLSLRVYSYFNYN